MAVIQALYGHTSEETAYLVPDYPYGRKVRCRIRYWIESGGNKGYRFCSQTEHPTRKVWNAPKKGTYAKVGANLYLDENTHVQCATLTEYSEAAACRTFAQNFPQSASIADVRTWCAMKCAYARKGARGEIV